MPDVRDPGAAPASHASRDAAPPPPGTTRLADYAPPPHLIDETRLTFALAPRGTRVRARIALRPNPDAPPADVLTLDGESLRTVRVAVDGADADPRIDGTTMRVPVPRAPFVLETEVEIDPEDNTELSGLYLSNGMFCTQCEAQGFRRITWYPDRPDVMAPFHVRIESELPVLLSNGDLVRQADGLAEWSDPHPKPSYLFALVAGDLRAHRAAFRTMEGRDVALAIWTRPGPDEGRCGWAMDALIRSMRWDEEVWGRAYDLSVFNVVAVDDFNMGAMENKGLNVFNSAAVLAAPEVTTDEGFARIEAIVAHEYFHNWTGNRITCRDWFQLCLKEGLTVYRDQRFTEDERGAGPERIGAVQTLRARQFREDAGPLAHPVRPESYQAIDNFYTATVYEKGAELVRMLRLIVGEEAWEGGLELYWSRHDGQAVTIEDWLACFADASGRDLTGFARWYSQAGTPRLSVETSWAPAEEKRTPQPDPGAEDEAPGRARGGDASADTAAHQAEVAPALAPGPRGPGARPGTMRVTLRQRTPPTPGQPVKAPVPIPLALGLLAADGSEALATTVLTLEDAEATFELPAPEGAVPSLLRGFSAPVILEREVPAAERAFLLARDPDPFARWEAGRQLGKAVLTGAILAAGTDPGTDAGAGALRAHLRGEAATDWRAALEAALADRSAAPALRALLIALPSEDDMAHTLHEAGHVPDPDAVRRAREAALDRIADMPRALAAATDEARVTEPYRPDAEQAGRRALHLAALRLVTRADGGAAAREALAGATDMTMAFGALSALLAAGAPGARDAAADFAETWAHERLVMDRWCALTVATAAPGALVDTAERLMARPDFALRNPNRVRAVLGAVPANPAGFHAANGSGYAFLAARIAELDPVNPQVAARLTGAFETWRRYDPGRQAHARAALESILAAPRLSADTAEMTTRLLAAPGDG